MAFFTVFFGIINSDNIINYKRISDCFRNIGREVFLYSGDLWRNRVLGHNFNINDISAQFQQYIEG